MKREILTTIIVACSFYGIEAADWPQFRGPDFNGSTNETDLPVNWSTTENVLWKTPLPGPSSATPAVVGEFIFITALDRTSSEISAMALDRKGGKVLWNIPIGYGELNQGYGRENFMTEPSAVSDGNKAIFLFGTGDLAAFDLNGRAIWHRNFQEEYGKFSINWGYASSPLLYENRLYVQVLHRNDAYVLCIDPATGENIWKIARRSDARAESREAYTTPLPLRNGQESLILILGGDHLTAHDPLSGLERWRWGTLNPNKRENFRAVASPVVGDGFVYINAPQLAPLYALRLGEEVPKLAWTFEHPTADIPTPVYYKDRLFLLAGKRKVITSLNPVTGKVIWQTPLEVRTFLRASPMAADGKIYCISADGEIVVLAATDELKILSRIEMGEYPCRSSIVASQGKLYIRTGENLYCIGRS